jgi:hypothetical protein
MAKRFFTFALLPLIAAAIPVQAQVFKNAQPMGTLENGVYHNNPTGIEFTLPPEWVVVSKSFSGGAHTVLVRDTVTNVIGGVWMTARTVDPASIPALMNRRLDMKVAQRNNFEGYKYRSDSVRQTTIGGKAALSVVADYTRTGQQMAEFITWIDGEKSRVAFSARMPAAELPAFQSRFDIMIQSAVVP